ncbi:unnamed protein product [Blepharisma stoltei]|uniref:Uncharacterized protein n=1 Tax=Blepharisma stoltei TaxID=1481888 RepID=A0AAU9J0G6_9CILI|nr:unnamed protein product [Blepharisma stoltei]
MEKVRAETIREFITMYPGITVAEFIEKLRERWTEHVTQIFDREISMVVMEYREAMKMIVAEVKKAEISS